MHVGSLWQACHCVSVPTPQQEAVEILANNFGRDNMKQIKLAIAGVGNCASSLVQGLEYYKGRNEEASAGLMHARIGDWGPSDIEIVAAFDIDRRGVFARTDLGGGGLDV